jgi:flagellar hook-associated protein 1 FlgK
MANYSAKILNNSVRSLNAQQAIIANTSNNIANVNTQGYTRRVVNLENVIDRGTGSAGIQLGSGVQVQGIQRMADEYINKLLQTQTSKQSSSELQESFVSRVEQLFSLTGETGTITKDVNAFFTALNDLTINPSSIEARKVVLEKAQSLVTSISGTYNTLADLQDEADQRISTEIQTVNGLLEQIAQSNSNITAIERSGANQVAADDRDRRDTLLQQLAKKISFNSVPNTDGSVNVYLTNGFTLVSGNNSYELNVTRTPSFASSAQPPSLSGGVLSSITYDYSNGAGTADFDLTQVLQNGEGSIGALLKMRGYNDPVNTSAFQADGFIVEVASRVEALAQDLLTRFNTTYLGNDEDSVTAGFQPNALDLDGNVPSTYGFFDFAYSGVKDANANGLPDDLASLNVTSFAKILSLNNTDPRKVAAARDQNPTNGATALVTGNGENIQALMGLRTASTSFSAGNFSLTGTYDDIYNETISHVSAEKSSISSRASLDKNYLISVQSQRDETSAVSLDEEFSNLIRFQKAYQASAKMIKVADDLLTTIIQLI